MFRVERNVLVLSVTVGATLLFFYAWYYLLPIHLGKLGASQREIGISYTLFSLGFTLAQILGGYLTDRFGRKFVIVIPTYAFPFLYLFLALAKVWWTCVIFYLAASILSAIQMPAFTSMISESSARKGKAFGFYEFSIASGIALGPLLGGFLVENISIQNIILLMCLATFVSAVVRSLFLTEERHREKIKRMDVWEGITKNYIWFIIAGSFVFLVLTLTVNGPFLSLFQKEVLSFSSSKINFLFAIGGLFSAISSLFGGRLIDKYGSKPILGVSLILHPLLIVLWVLSKGVLPFFILSFLFSQFFYICYQVIITDISSEKARGRMIGIFGTITGVVSSTGPVLGMQMKLRFGWSYPFYLSLMFGIVGVLSLLNVRLKKAR
jgi:MFS family permease